MNSRQTIQSALFSLIILVGCQQNNATATGAEKSQAASPVSLHQQDQLSGKLIETFDAGGYTYVQIKTDRGTVWAAGPVSKLKKGDQIGFGTQMPMNNFHSKTLGRDFDLIYFVSGFSVNGVSPDIVKMDPHEKMADQATRPVVLKSFKKVDNGQTIAEILQNRDKFKNRSVSVRGQVTKYTADVMGKNWIHIRDNSTDKDLTLTTHGTAKLNDIIVLKGQLALNKDFGYGYTYELIVEDASLKVE